MGQQFTPDDPEPNTSLSGIRWAVNVLLEKIAEKFEGWETMDIWRSDAAMVVRGFKHDTAKPAGVVEVRCDTCANRRPVWLRREGDYAIVLVEIDGQWVEIIREYYDGNFSHIWEDRSVLASAVPSQDGNTP